MYIQGFVIAVPEGNKDLYKRMAELFWEIASESGALEHVEAWEADVPDGEVTDFRRSVQAKQGEKIVFSWVTWPDKQAAERCHETMISDPRMQEMGEQMPFDGKRMIFGGFEPLVFKRA